MNYSCTIQFQNLHFNQIMFNIHGRNKDHTWVEEVTAKSWGSTGQKSTEVTLAMCWGLLLVRNDVQNLASRERGFLETGVALGFTATYFPSMLPAATSTNAQNPCNGIPQTEKEKKEKISSELYTKSTREGRGSGAWTDRGLWRRVKLVRPSEEQETTRGLRFRAWVRV